MSRQFQAIYENGVLRPLEPLDLKEHEVVSVSLEKAAVEAIQKGEDRLSRQQRSIARLLEETARLPVQSPKDGFSNRDHDAVIYGKTK
jgi:predicted DNA-binding antitoxin AbrB/MazE fold protein